MVKDSAIARPKHIKPDFAVASDGALDLTSFAGELLPNDDAILTTLGGDLKHYTKLLEDDQVRTLMQQRQDALVAAEWEVIAGGDDPRDVEAADMLREALEGVAWDDVTRKMHKGILYGYSVAECMWGRDGTRITLDAIKVRKPWRFGFGMDGALKLRVGPQVRVMPERKFWIARWGADDDDSPYGSALGSPLWWPVYLKRNGAKFWAAYLDKFGSPAVKALYPDTATPEEKNTALAAARAFRSESAIAIPAGFDVQLVEAAKSAGGSYEDFLRYWDDAVAKLILSQTGTTRQGQYAGTGKVLDGVKAEMVKADADLLCESFSMSVAVWLTEWNVPGAKPPKVWRRVVNASKDAADMARDTSVYKLGLELTDNEIQRRYGEAWRRRTQSPSQSVPGSPGSPEAPDATGADFAEGAPDDASSLVDQLEAVTNAASTSMVDDMRAVMEAVMAEGGTLADYAERLQAHYPLAGHAALAEALEGALVVANLTGRKDQS